MSTESKGRQFHKQAEMARERGDFEEALVLTDRAMVAYVEAGDILGFAEVLQSRALTARHLEENLEEKGRANLWLRYALHAAMAGAEAAQKSGNESATIVPYHTVGKTFESLAEYGEALKWHQRAVDGRDNLPQQHNRDSYKAELMGHLYFCQMMTGDEAGYERLLGAIKMLEASEEERYNKDVWLSGMHMSAALALDHLGKREKAGEHLSKAKAIIDANADLVLRKGQWEKLAEKFNA